MKKAYSILERQLTIIRHLQEKSLKVVNSEQTEVLKQLAIAIDMLSTLTGSEIVHHIKNEILLEENTYEKHS